MGFESEARDLRGSALVTGQPRYLGVRGEIVETSGRDRAVTLSFELPLGAEAASSWWDNVDTVRKTGGTGLFETVVRSPAGQTGTHSPYPIACVSGALAVAMGIPLDRPVFHRFSYSPQTGRLSVSFDFALTRSAARTPSKASFAFVIYATDPLWGFRSALERYYAIYPAAFERRIPKIGGWVAWGNLKAVPDFADYGFRYHWGPADPGAIAFDTAGGVYPFLYSDSARFFADLGTFSHRPTGAETVPALRELVESGDPRAVILGRPQAATGRIRFEGLQREMGPAKAEDWLKRAVAAVRISATTDDHGAYNVGYLLSRKDWGPPDWWTGRLFCNLDPAIAGGYGNFLLEDILNRVFPGQRARGGAYSGVALDNYFVDAETLDFRPDHVVASEIPLTFARGTNRPVVVGDFATLRWVAELGKRLRAQGGWVMGNLVTFPYPFAASVLDIHGYELKIADSAPIARALAYHKPVVTVPASEGSYEEAFLKKHVRFGFIPGGYVNERFSTDQALRGLYKRYVAPLVRCAEAGWEPMTFATSDNSAIKVERFGRPGSPLFLSVTNSSTSEQAGSIEIDAGKLGLRAEASRSKDLLYGKDVSWVPRQGARAATIRLGPGEALIVELNR